MLRMQNVFFIEITMIFVMDISDGEPNLKIGKMG